MSTQNRRNVTVQMKKTELTVDRIVAIGIAKRIRLLRHKYRIKQNKRIKVEYFTDEEVVAMIRKHHGYIVRIARCSVLRFSKELAGDYYDRYEMPDGKIIQLAVSADDSKNKPKENDPM